MWQEGDGFMADEYLSVSLEIPVRTQLTTEEVDRSKQLSNQRIRVESVIQRLIQYPTIPWIGSINQIITVCVVLSNFKDAIRKT